MWPAGGEQPADFQTGKTLGSRNMVKAGLAAGDEFPDRAGGDGGGNRAAKFVDEQFHGPVLLPGAAHFFIEATISGGRITAIKGSADDGMAGIGENYFFSGGFSFAIDAQRVGRVRLGIIAAPAIENQIRRKKDKGYFSGKQGKVRGDFDVQFPGERRVGLALGALAQRGAVDDQLRFMVLESGSDGEGIGEIKPSPGKGNDVIMRRVSSSRLKEIITDEAARAG